MSEEFIVREDFEIPEAFRNDIQTSLENELTIEPKNQTEVEEQDDLEGLKETLGGTDIWEVEASSGEFGEQEKQSAKSNDSPEPEGLVKTADNHVLISQLSKDVLEPIDAEDLEDLGALGDQQESTELGSGPSFNSCSSYKQMRCSILKRQRNASTVSLDSGVELDSSTYSIQKSHQDFKQGPSYGDCLRTTTSLKVVMERRSLSLTPDSSDGDYEISLDEVYQRFSVWFSRPEIDTAFSAFFLVDEDRDGYICLTKLKRLLEMLEIPQTHLAAKKAMTHVVGCQAERLNFCQLLIIYATLMHRADLQKWGLQDLDKQRLALSEAVDVSQVGVSGAKLFFEAKIALQNVPLHLNPEQLPLNQPVTRLPEIQSSTSKSQRTSSQGEHFKSAAAVFKKLESEH
ncbi:hypothetical protein KR009_005459 [Drosophila setifemur]|nr:hypothetical protein KR009_005459 [Drosophila setifemur]